MRCCCYNYLHVCNNLIYFIYDFTSLKSSFLRYWAFFLSISWESNLWFYLFSLKKEYIHLVQKSKDSLMQSLLLPPTLWLPSFPAWEQPVLPVSCISFRNVLYIYIRSPPPFIQMVDYHIQLCSLFFPLNNTFLRCFLISTWETYAFSFYNYIVLHCMDVP